MPIFWNFPHENPPVDALSLAFPPVASAQLRIEVQPGKVASCLAIEAGMQLVVTGHYVNGDTRDLTRLATFAAVPATRRRSQKRRRHAKSGR